MSLPNGRDVAGMGTVDGGTLNGGVLLRSALPRDEAHAEALRAAGVRYALDLRTAEERERQPPVLAAGTTVIEADLLADEPESGPASLGAIARAAVSGDREALDPERLDEIFLAGYRSFVDLASARAATGDVLRHLATADGPTVVHCTAGKDRTGWVVAVTLTTVGVDWDTVMADYLRSGPEVLALFAPYRDRLTAEGIDVTGMERAIAVFPEYLEASRERALEVYGSWEDYLAAGIGVAPETVDNLRARLVGD